MSFTNQTFRFVPVKASTTHEIYNLTSPVTPGTEFSQLLPTSTKQVMIRCRGNAKLQFTFVTGETATKFITIPRGTTYHAENLDLTATTIFMEADKPSQVVEVEVWS